MNGKCTNCENVASLQSCSGREGKYLYSQISVCVCGFHQPFLPSLIRKVGKKTEKGQCWVPGAMFYDFFLFCFVFDTEINTNVYQ